MKKSQKKAPAVKPRLEVSRGVRVLLSCHQHVKQEHEEANGDDYKHIFADRHYDQENPAR